ncbi:unnamed protein product [Thelazia callipaeda]|uniref:tRNA (adenine(58)-N(1))-methyltransferase non-catalytic subunit TRM6 n=1 Tax=Thelazia callipaeda TaxID=103827 RepID=A0A0N5D4X0_THECL|nr:unnamed protein product [Thelazia callipaeda]
MIQVGSHVIIQKMGGEHIRVCKISRRAKILIEKLRFEIDGAIDQPYGLFEADCATSSSPKSNGVTNTAVVSKSLTDEIGNVNIAQARQTVTQDEIIKMKDTGVPAEQLIARLVDGSTSFSERTIYSQNKYINKKAKKHSDHVYLLRPTLRLVAESYYKKDPERVAHLRVDLLSHILTLSGIHSGSRCIVFDQCLGLLTCAVLTRLGGSGACIHLHRGSIAQAIPCVDSMDFDKKTSSVFMPLCISSLLKGCEEKLDENKDFAVKHLPTVCRNDKCLEKEMEVGEEILNGKEEIADKQRKQEDSKDVEVSVGVVFFCSFCNIVSDPFEKKAERQRLQRQAWQLMQNADIEILFIATRSVNPVDILERTWSSLRLSSTVVVYCPFAEDQLFIFYCVNQYLIFKDFYKVLDLSYFCSLLQPLFWTYHWLKSKNAVQVHVVDAFYRSHQVLQDRSHPIMQQFITGGFILSAIKVEQRC